MKQLFKIVDINSLIRVQLAVSVIVLFCFMHRPAVVHSEDSKTVHISKSIEALQVDFSNRVIVPSAPKELDVHFYKLPEVVFTPLLTCLWTIGSRYVNSYTRNIFYVLTCINAPPVGISNQSFSIS